MAKYVFPAIFTPEESGYTIVFPDVKNCFTEGDNLTEAMENANDVLCMMLYNLERLGKEIPEVIIHPREEEYEIRKALVEKALNALATEVDGQTIFE